MLVVCININMMKRIFLILITTLFIQHSNAQSNNFNKAVLGSWLGELISESVKPVLELNFIKANIYQNGKGTVSGFSYVNGKNKTSFTGTVKLVDGYLEFTLKEAGSKTTNGIFELAVHITELISTQQEIHLNGNWTSNKTKKVKQVSLVKN